MSFLLSAVLGLILVGIFVLVAGFILLAVFVLVVHIL